MENVGSCTIVRAPCVHLYLSTDCCCAFHWQHDVFRTEKIALPDIPIDAVQVGAVFKGQVEAVAHLLAALASAPCENVCTQVDGIHYPLCSESRHRMRLY